MGLHWISSSENALQVFYPLRIKSRHCGLINVFKLSDHAGKDFGSKTNLQNRYHHLGLTLYNFFFIFPLHSSEQFPSNRQQKFETKEIGKCQRSGKWLRFTSDCLDPNLIVTRVNLGAKNNNNKQNSAVVVQISQSAEGMEWDRKVPLTFFPCSHDDIVRYISQYITSQVGDRSYLPFAKHIFCRSGWICSISQCVVSGMSGGGSCQ